VRGLRLIGPGKKFRGSVGIQFDSESGVVRGVGFFGLEIGAFGTGMSFENNAYLLSFYNFHVYRCHVGISMPEGKANYGENIKFIGGGVGSSDLGVYNANPNGNFHFIATSIDFCVAAARTEGGGIFFDQPHFEFNETGAESRRSHFVTGEHNSSKIVISGGHLLFHSRPVGDYIFETKNENWGGGINVSNLSMFNAYTATGFLCGGTGKFKTVNLIPDDGNGSGSGNGAVMPSRAANILVDGTFGLTALVDPYVKSLSSTSRMSSPALKLRSVQGKLIAVVSGTGPKASIIFDVPCVAGMTYASAFTIAEVGAAGRIYVIESFVAAPRLDSMGRARDVRADARGQSALELSEAVGATPYVRVNGATAWNRQAPPWATHFRLQLSFEEVDEGTVTFSEVVMTGM
jgi:hypothetical protein